MLRRKNIYIHEKERWPQFLWQKEELGELLLTVHRAQARLLGKMEVLGFSLQSEATLNTITADVVKSSEIEGELLPDEQVRSSVARRLGMVFKGAEVKDKRVDGVVEMMTDATQNFKKPLTEKRLFNWHAALFPTGRTGMTPITVAAYRKTNGGPMQVVSGAMGKEKIHFEAPEAKRLKNEMAAFSKWMNAHHGEDKILKAAIAHLWFITIHPFDDGNGRIARTITDMLLSRADDSAYRFYSLSTEIQKTKKNYYNILETTQKGNLDITLWLRWFLQTLLKAINSAEEKLADVLFKAAFWQKHSKTIFNPRQVKMLNKLMDNFDGKLTTTKWAKISKCSQDTAMRDIQSLIDLKVLKKEKAGGRSSGYVVVR